MARVTLALPELGIADQPVKLSLWLVRRGRAVVAGDRLAEIVAGGITVDLPAPASGELVRLLVAEDDELRPGQPLAVIETGEKGAGE